MTVNKRMIQDVIDYVKYDTTAKEMKSKMDPLNKKIKKYMSENKMKNFEAGDVKVSYQLQTRSTMNEDALIGRLKKLGLHEAIKTVEKPDEQVIEQLIFEGKLPASELQSCITTKYVEVLKVSK